MFKLIGVTHHSIVQLLFWCCNILVLFIAGYEWFLEIA